MIIKLWRKLSGRERIESLEARIRNLELENRLLENVAATECFRRTEDSKKWDIERIRIAGERDAALRAGVAAEAEIAKLHDMNKEVVNNLMAVEDEKAALIKQIEALKSAAPTISPIDKSSICQCGHIIHLNGVGECASHGCECKRKTKVEPS